MDSFIGQQIDNYRIDSYLGEGGMGVVYRAFDLNLKQARAIKVMHRRLAEDPRFRKLFLNEATLAAQLGDHPSIVTVHYLGVERDPVYMVMSYIPGGSLEAYVRQLQKTGEVVDLREILFLLAQVADALGYAHSRPNPVVHRDVKPSNILVQRLERPEREGEPPLRAIVTDFGLAKVLNALGESTATEQQGPMGTFGYMSPEQTLLKGVDGRSDIYSLGVMFYLLATGRLPLDIRSATDAVLKHQQNEIPPDPRELRPNLPENVAAIIRTAIAKQPSDRYQKAESMAEALRTAARGLTREEITQFIQQQTQVSLATIQKPDEPVLEPSRLGFDLTPAPGQARLVIAQKGQAPRTISMVRDEYTLGRSNANDILLEGNTISRQHARIERTQTGWQVIDLGSSNGTFIGEVQLLKDVPEPWAEGTVLRIGPYFLHWQPKSAKSQYSGPAIDFPEARSASGETAVAINPTQLELEAGGQADFEIVLANLGRRVDHYTLRIEGLPQEWVAFSQERVQLNPDNRQTLGLSLKVPRDSRARAGQHPFRLSVHSSNNPTETVFIACQLSIKPFEEFDIDLQPSQITNGGSAHVTIINRGNADGDYSLTGRDPAEAIRFEGQRGRVRVPVGGEQSLALTLKAKERPVRGQAQYLPFQVQVTSTTGKQASRDGQLKVLPTIPAWAIPIGGSLLLVLCLSAACLFSLSPVGKKLIARLTGSQPAATSTNVVINLTEPATTTAATEPITAVPATLPPATLPPGDNVYVWSMAENRPVIAQGQKFWEKYQADAGVPGLYLRTDTVEAFGDFIELETDQTFVMEQAGARSSGSWEIDADRLTLSH